MHPKVRAVVEPFCSHMETVRTRKPYTNDATCLWIFFGPICQIR